MNTQATTLASWRLKGIGILRIVFCLVCAVDAWFKWQPSFINNFASYLTGPLDSQPAWIQSWINFWINDFLVGRWSMLFSGSSRRKDQDAPKVA